MNILGINAFHADASAALLQDGKLVAAVEEERFTRVKHWAGFPSHAIRFCLKQGNIRIRDLDHVAVSFDPKANLSQKLIYAMRNRPALSAIRDRLKRLGKANSIVKLLSSSCQCDPRDIKAKLHHIEHHLAHAASTFFTSNFDQATLLTIDGMGDFCSMFSGWGEGNRIQVGTRTYYPHSLGFLYNALTLFLGFPNYGDEYKVMGLAPYGDPVYLEPLHKIVDSRDGDVRLNLDYFNHHKKGISMIWDNSAPKVDPFYSRQMENLLGSHFSAGQAVDQRGKDIAASLQKTTEEVIFDLLNKLYDIYPHEQLCLAGGVAMNSAANGKIHRSTPFQQIFIPPGAADNGTAFGAAFYVWHQVLDHPREYAVDHAYWGPEFGDSACRKAVESCASNGTTYRYLDDAPLCDVVADYLAAGNVVGWYQGRMEFGARALGNRSLLADPRRADIRNIINKKIKFREAFRPFAPSILRSKVNAYFEDDVSCPFMEKIIPIRKEKRCTIPAVTHVDGSGRLQTVDSGVNPKFAHLITKFEERTGVPLVLNTSLNENEPMVCTPQEAMDCFTRTKMDCLVLGNWIVKRETNA